MSAGLDQWGNPKGSSQQETQIDSLPIFSQGLDGYPGDAGSPGEPGDQGAKVGVLAHVVAARADRDPCPPGGLLPAAVLGLWGKYLGREAQQRGPIPADKAGSQGQEA